MSRKKTALPEDLQARLSEILNYPLADASADTMMQRSDVSLQEVDSEAMER